MKNRHLLVGSGMYFVHSRGRPAPEIVEYVADANLLIFSGNVMIDADGPDKDNDDELTVIQRVEFPDPAGQPWEHVAADRSADLFDYARTSCG